MGMSMGKNLDSYYFIKITDGECIKAKDEDDALNKAIEKGIVDPTRLNDYACVYKRDDGSVIAGTIQIGINWDE